MIIRRVDVIHLEVSGDDSVSHALCVIRTTNLFGGQGNGFSHNNRATLLRDQRGSGCIKGVHLANTDI